ncbi:septation protein SepH, partial [Tsukamurella soli]
MQELRVVGLDDDGTSVVCEGASGRFLIPIDETLKAAVRGDLSRGVQTTIEIESVLRPREIQARIRAGATMEEVASLAGVPVERIKRFANPVLLERSRAAEMAALAHPVRGDGPMAAKLSEVVANALHDRGHTDTTEWDAWKATDNRWVVRIAWSVGKSRNEAHFKYVPGAHGGTATPMDAHAKELLDPDARRALRSIDSARTAPAEPADAGREAEERDDEAVVTTERVAGPRPDGGV